MTETTEILKERGQRYGRFDSHANVTQRLKGVIAGELHIRRKELENDQQEALDMICHKIGRIINGDANYEDSWRDIAGYAQLVADRLLEPGNVDEKEKKESSDLEFIKFLDSRIYLLESKLEKISKRKPIGDKEINKNEARLIDMIIENRALRYELIQKVEKDSSESVKDVWNYTLSESGKAAINAVREQIKEERLKSSAPEPVLPAGWTRPSKAYPQVAEDPSTGWQYVYGDGGWKRLIKPLHEMTPDDLQELGELIKEFEEASEKVQQEKPASPESVSDAAEESLAKAVRMMGFGWKLVESANSIIAKDDSGLIYIWYNGKWFLAPQLGYIY